MSTALLDIRGLSTHFSTKQGDIRAVDDVNLTVWQGESLGLVGESGCGKSALGLSILRLIMPPGRIVSGQIMFRDSDLLKLTLKEMEHVRGSEISMIFQDPSATLNPVIAVGDQVAEVLKYHGHDSRSDRKARVIQMLRAVGIPQPEQRYFAYPHELSGGMQQRIIIACALILKPTLIIADEPTTALDVTVQAQILSLLREIIDSETNSSVILISHDLGVIAQMCERVCVMYAGDIVEVAPTETIMAQPLHPYTAGLLASIPRLDLDDQELVSIPGTVANSIKVAEGCKFHPRCPHAMDRCRIEKPILKEQAHSVAVACHLYDQP